MKKLVVATVVVLSGIALCACQKEEVEVASSPIAVEQDANDKVSKIVNEVVETPKANTGASEHIPAEYKQVTTNENGVKIYGKIVTADTASPTAKKIIEENALGDKKQKDKGYTYTYSEYTSDAYGGTVIIKTGNKEGSQSIYNENGDRFIAGGADTADADLEKVLANYRLGNAIADAMDKKYKK